jgi:hypothetical protein
MRLMRILQMITITNVKVENNEKYQQAATSKLGITITSASIITKSTERVSVPDFISLAKAAEREYSDSLFSKWSCWFSYNLE